MPNVLHLTPDRRIGPGDFNEIDRSLRRRSNSNPGVLWDRKRVPGSAQPAGLSRPGKLLHSAAMSALWLAAFAKIKSSCRDNFGVQFGLSPSCTFSRGIAL